MVVMANAFVLQGDSKVLTPEPGWASSAWNPWPLSELLFA